MFDTVHAETAGKHQDKYDKDGRDDLIPLFIFIQNGCDNVERIIFGVEPVQMKDPRNTKHTENNRNIAKNGDRDKDIKKTADPVTFIADLYDVKDFLFHGMPFLKLRYTLL